MLFNSRTIWIVPELASGLVWTCLIATVILASARDYLPLTSLSARYVLVACLVVATATLGVFLLMIAIKHALDALVKEVLEVYGKDFRPVPWVAAGGVGTTALLWFFIIVTRAVRRAIRVVSHSTSNMSDQQDAHD